jgi:hypothetical protein
MGAAVWKEPSMDVTGIGAVPMLYIEAWATHEPFRRLGFREDELSYLVGASAQMGAKEVLHLVLRTQGKEFIYTLLPLDRSVEQATLLLNELCNKIRTGELSDEELERMYRATRIGTPGPEAIAALRGQLIAALTLKGIGIPAIAN